MIQREHTLALRGGLALAVIAGCGALGGAAFGDEITLPIADPAQQVELEVSIMQGQISVEGYDGDEVQVAWRELDEEGDEHHRTEHASADAEGLRRIPNRSFGLDAEADGNRVEISSGWGGSELDVTVRVPRRTSVELGSVNCEAIAIRGVDGEHELSCVNGDVEAIDVSGSVVARSNNGDVKVVFVRADADKPMSFITFNGDVDVTFPAGFGADLEMSTLQGEIYSDTEVEVIPTEPKVEREAGRTRFRVERSVHARLGGGGAEVHLKTFNGDIRVRQP